jgi:F-type H+-transporting ATPase subunit b
MSKYVKIAIALAIPALLFASGGEHHTSAMAEQYLKMTGRETDFIPRIFNFVLLMVLLVYLLKKPLTEFLQNRSKSIADTLAEIEQKRQAAKDAKIAAQQELENAKAKVSEIIEDSKKEVALLKEKIQKATEQEIASMEKSCNDMCEIEKRKSIREVTTNILDENISSSDIPLDGQKIVNIVTKEVA